MLWGAQKQIWDNMGGISGSPRLMKSANNDIKQAEPVQEKNPSENVNYWVKFTLKGAEEL